MKMVVSCCRRKWLLQAVWPLEAIFDDDRDHEWVIFGSLTISWKLNPDH